MKKSDKSGRSPKKATGARNGNKQLGPLSDLLSDLDPETIGLLQQALLEAGEFGPGSFQPTDAVGLFTDYLDHCKNKSLENAEGTDLLGELLGGLTELRIDANGGDRAADESIQKIRALLEEALGDWMRDPTAMMMTGKILTDAGWDVPDGLTQAMSRALRGTTPDAQGAAGADILSSLLDSVLEAGPNPFDFFEFMNSLTSAFPSDARIALMNKLIAADHPRVNQAIEGYVLHNDETLARASAEALAALAKKTPVDSILVERLVLMRHWLPPSRRPYVDETIKAMRLNTRPPVETQAAKTLKCYASVCDGSGAMQIFVTQKFGARYQVAATMMKTSGVADAFILTDLSKSEMDRIVHQMKAAVTMTETDLSGLARLFRLAIAANQAAGKLPPFKTIEVIEVLGLGSVHPDPASPLELIERLLADAPPLQKDVTAVAKAQGDVSKLALADQWFDADQAVDVLLKPIKGRQKRIDKLIKDYLPERRQFWARQCAITALVLRDDKKTLNKSWIQLALVGRDIASDTPLDQIPLMKRIAELSVWAFEHNS